MKQIKTDGMTTYEVTTNVFTVKIDVSVLNDFQGKNIKSVSRTTVAINDAVNKEITGVNLK